MPFNVPTVDGNPVFGLVTKFVPERREAVTQDSAFFGQNGILSLFGGTRGWVFHIEGVFAEPGDPATAITAINLDILAIQNLVGPLLHTLVDTSGNTFNNVRFRGKFTPAPQVFPTDTGWCRAYTMEMDSLSG